MSEEAKKSQHIGDHIRKLLLDIDLRIVHAEGESKVAQREFECHSKINTVRNQKIALEAKMRKECYANYVESLQKAKTSINNDLDRVLSTYNNRYKRIWVAYFIEKKTYDEIAVEVNYTRENVKKVVFRLKEDLVKNYALEGK